MAYKLTEIAQDQLINSYVYGYLNFGENQAERYQQEIRECFDLLSDNPRIAHVREGYRQPLRIHHHAKHYIAYLLKDDSSDILIVAILRDSVDLVKHLAGSTT